jgi:CBS domain-containing protein
VVENGRLTGLLRLEDIKAVERPRWPFTTVGDVMRSLEQIRSVTPDTPVMEAMETLGSSEIEQLPVMSDHQLEGIISKGQVLRFLQTRAELKSAH